MGGAEFPPCWLFGLRWPSTGAYRLFGGVNGRLQEGSCQGVLPRTSAASVLVPVVSHSCPPPLQETLQHQQVRLVQSPMGVTAPSPWVLTHMLFCVCSPRVQSLFPPVMSKSCNQILLAFKVWFSGNSSSRCWTPRLGSLTWASEPSLKWMDFCGISVLQFVSHPPSSYGTWFYCDCAPPTFSLQLLLCLWMWGIFLVSSSVFLSMTLQQLVVIPVLSQEGVSACPSTTPPWTNLLPLIHFNSKTCTKCTWIFNPHLRIYLYNFSVLWNSAN